MKYILFVFIACILDKYLRYLMVDKESKTFLPIWGNYAKRRGIQCIFVI